MEARPKIRRGALSLMEIGEQLREELAQTEGPAEQVERDALRLINGAGG